MRVHFIRDSKPHGSATFFSLDEKDIPVLLSAYAREEVGRLQRILVVSSWVIKGSATQNME